MSSPTIEERLTAVENAVAHLQQLIASRTPAPNWLERVTGSMRDEPAFEEVLEYGRAIRQADRPPEDAQQ
jgi:hypothetical protein